MNITDTERLDWLLNSKNCKILTWSVYNGEFLEWMPSERRAIDKEIENEQTNEIDSTGR